MNQNFDTVTKPEYRLFLDDQRMPAKKDNTMHVVRCYEDAVHYMNVRGCPQYISFDHDLGDPNAKTGYDLAKWLVEKDLDSNGAFIPATFGFDVHSQNPVGAENIRKYLRHYLEYKANQYFNNSTDQLPPSAHPRAADD